MREHALFGVDKALPHAAVAALAFGLPRDLVTEVIMKGFFGSLLPMLRDDPHVDVRSQLLILLEHRHIMLLAILVGHSHHGRLFTYLISDSRGFTDLVELLHFPASLYHLLVLKLILHHSWPVHFDGNALGVSYTVHLVDRLTLHPLEPLCLLPAFLLLSPVLYLLLIAHFHLVYFELGDG